MASPTARSLKWLRDQGYTAEVVEKWNQYSRTRRDLFNFGDILAFLPDVIGCLMVQATTTPNISARLKKMEGIENVEKWKLAHNQVVVHGWAKRGERGKRKKWQLKIVIL